MAPSSLIVGDNAPSTLLSSSSIVTPSIIVGSCAAGVSILAFLYLLTVTIYRQIIAPRLAKPKIETVPRLVITDTSLFPASSVVVNGEADLDKVIASFKPLGRESHGVEEKATVREVPLAHILDEDEEQFFPLPKIPSPNPDAMSFPEQARLFRSNRTNTKAQVNVILYPNEQRSCVPTNFPSSQDNEEASEGVWWYDFHGEGSLDSTNSLSDGNGTVSSESLYSIGSARDVPATLKLPVHVSGATISALDQALGVGNEHTHDAIKHESDGESENDSQEMPYDKDILAYCWRLSGDGPNKADGSRSSRSGRTTDEEEVTKFATSSRAQSMRISNSNGTFDERILEYCWRVSDSSSYKSTDHVSEGVQPRVRFTAAARSMSDASVFGLETTRSHDSAHVVYAM